MKETELLAPAGSYETLVAAIHAGADAVYVGGSRFSARAYADNFTEEELLRAIDYSHLKGKRIMLAVNTLLKNRELDEMCEWLTPYYEAGIDAVIVQDIGVFSMIRKNFPDLPLHASTQMTVTSAEGVKLLEQMGAARAVLARELSLDEIQEIRRHTALELEAFVHGALCYCYSGKCLMSSLIGGRSGNRGKCAQPCRLPYQLKLPDGQRKEESYCLSLKDLCAIGQIPQMAEAGVYSFKIEGRMKQAEYTAGVVSVYRKYIDRYLQGKQACSAVERKDYQALLNYGNRSGFTNGYLCGQTGKGMLTVNCPSHTKTSDGGVAAELPSGRSCMPKNQGGRKQIPSGYPCMPKNQGGRKEPIQAELHLEYGKPARLRFRFRQFEGMAEGGLVEKAQNRAITKQEAAQKVSALGNTFYRMDSLKLELGENLFAAGGMLKKLRRDALTALEEQIFAAYRRKKHSYKLSDLSAADNLEMQNHELAAAPEMRNGELAAGLEMRNGELAAAPEMQKSRGTEERTKNPYLAVQVSMPEQLDAVLECEFVNRIYLSADLWKDYVEDPQMLVNRFLRAKKEVQVYCALPDIVRKSAISYLNRHWEAVLLLAKDGFLANSYDAIGFLLQKGAAPERIILDSTVYHYSDKAAEYWRNQGFSTLTVPAELNYQELKHRDLRDSELIIYGKQPLMYSAQCLLKNYAACRKKDSVLELIDRKKKKFCVHTHCSFCYNTVYNYAPLFLLHHAGEIRQLHLQGYRMVFSEEEKARVKMLLDCYLKAFREGQKLLPKQYVTEYTNGHWKRGVD